MEKIAVVLGVIALLFVAVCIFAFPTMWIVSHLFTPQLISAVFGTSSIGFTQSLLLNAICSILFKSVNTGKD